MSIILTKILTSKIAIGCYGVIAVILSIIIFSLIIKGYNAKIDNLNNEIAELQVYNEYLSNEIKIKDYNANLITNVYTNTINIEKYITNEVSREVSNILININNNYLNSINKLFAN